MTAFAFVTDRGAVVRADVLESYATKSATRQVPTQKSFSDEAGLVVPRYDPTALATLLEGNTPHLVACRQKAEDVLGRGWDFEPVGESPDSGLRTQLVDWFDAQAPPTSAIDALSSRSVLMTPHRRRSPRSRICA